MAAASTVAAVATPVKNDDHHHPQQQQQQQQQSQPPLIATIHRNGRLSEAAPAANKAVAIPKVKSKSKSKSKSADKTHTNGDLSEHLIEFSIADSIDGNQSSNGDQSTLVSFASPVSDKLTQQHTPTPADLNVSQANRTAIAVCSE